MKILNQIIDPESNFLSASWILMGLFVALLTSLPQTSIVVVPLFIVTLSTIGAVSLYHFVIGINQFMEWLQLQQKN
jgi:hypothetical protein